MSKVYSPSSSKKKAVLSNNSLSTQGKITFSEKGYGLMANMNNTESIIMVVNIACTLNPKIDECR
jgi:hypothetical protein